MTRNDLAAWFEASRRDSWGPTRLVLVVLLVCDVFAVVRLVIEPHLVLVLVLSLFLPFTLLLLGQELVPRLIERTGPSRYDDQNRPQFGWWEGTAAGARPSCAVVLREPSTDVERLVRDLSGVAGITLDDARERVLGDPQDFPHPWSAPDDGGAAQGYGPGRLLVVGVDRSTARDVAARVGGPWATVDVVEDVAGSADGAGLHARPVATARPARPANDSYRLVVMGAFLAVMTAGLVSGRGAGAWPFLFFWGAWALAVRRHLRR